jgi:hypothetical protein
MHSRWHGRLKCKKNGATRRPPLIAAAPEGAFGVMAQPEGIGRHPGPGAWAELAPYCAATREAGHRRQWRKWQRIANDQPHPATGGHGINDILIALVDG